MISRKSTIILCSMIVMVSIIGPALADQDGEGDSDQTCYGCHGEGGSGTADLTAIPEPLEVDQAGTITVTVNADNINDDNYIVGVMLLNDENDNIKDDGWTIDSDPNGNGSPYNYNEKTGVSGDTEFSWTVAAPATPGDYTVKTRTFYGGDNANYQDSDTKTITVNAAPVAPPEDSNETSGSEEVSEGVNLEALKFGLLAGFGAMVIVFILRKRW